MSIFLPLSSMVIKVKCMALLHNCQFRDKLWMKSFPEWSSSVEFPTSYDLVEIHSIHLHHTMYKVCNSDFHSEAPIWFVSVSMKLD